jgi:hypothetical protein
MDDDAATDASTTADDPDPTTNGHGDPDADGAIEARLRELDVATMTPLEALNTLAALADRADDP